MSAAASPVKFLRLQDVTTLVALSKSEIYRQIAAGTFPAPRQFRDSRRSFWTSVEVQRWQAQQVGEDEWAALLG